MKKVAVFDIDGTIFRSSLLLELVERLIQKGLFPETTRAAYEREEREWLDRKGDYEAYINRVVQVFAEQLKGVSYDEVNYLSGEIVEEKKDRVYRYTRDLIKELKGQGYYLLAISHSPKLIVDGFAYEMGFDKAYGTIYEVGPNECFTGTVEDKDLINNKAAVLQRAMRKEGLTFEGSVAVGDTESDIPMLEMAERPIAFNPNAKLYKHAKVRQWEVVVERKDVIYTL
ncbi:MAG: HAD family phosphatase [Candidatus Paceibacterota bacterium]